MTGEWSQAQYNTFKQINKVDVEFVIDKEAVVANYQTQLQGLITEVLATGEVSATDTRNIGKIVTKLSDMGFDTTFLKSKLDEMNSIIKTNGILREQIQKVTNANQKAELQKHLEENNEILKVYAEEMNDIVEVQLGVNLVFDKEKAIGLLEASLSEVLNVIKESGAINSVDILNIGDTIGSLGEQGFDTTKLQMAFDEINSIYNANMIIREAIVATSDKNEKAELQRHYDENNVIVSQKLDEMNAVINNKLADFVVDPQGALKFKFEEIGQVAATAMKDKIIESTEQDTLIGLVKVYTDMGGQASDALIAAIIARDWGAVGALVGKQRKSVV